MATEIQPSPVESGKYNSVIDTQQTITLPRRIVYFQAALLGVIATTFFVFGMMVGTLTSRSALDAKIFDCSISGTVLWSSDEEEIADDGAVIFILPLGKTPERRLNPRSVHPDAFDAINNEVIEMIVGMGGAVVRTNRNGEFSVDVNSPARYSVVVVSKHSDNKKSLNKKQMAALSTYFMPAEEVRKNKSIFVQSVQLDSTRKSFGEIKF